MKIGRSSLPTISRAPGRGRLWNFTKHYQYIGGQGGAGIGYGAPAAVGAALANRKHGRLTVNIQCDGDLNYAPGVLWTAAHHKIPMLNVMHNNRAYHQERMYLQMMGNKFDRGVTDSDIGTALSTRTSITRRSPRAMACMRKAHSDPQRSGSRDQARHRAREGRRAGVDRRRHSTSLEIRIMQ